MKTTKLMTALTLLVACEGEPPKTPEMASTAPSAAPVETSTAAEDTTTTAPTGSPCPCQCPTPASTVATTTGDGGAPVVTTAPVATADAGAPVVAARGEIVGTITTTPAYLASVSVAFLEDAPKEPDRGVRARIDNHQMAFSPMVQVITAGGSITFNNSDPFPHNVFSPDGKFNLGTIPQNSAAAPHKFDQTGEFTLLCNLHPGMIGYLVVSPSSYFGKGDAKGRFRIKDVPPGTYKITAWAPRLPVVTQTVTVSGGEVRSDFELHR